MKKDENPKQTKEMLEKDFEQDLIINDTETTEIYTSLFVGNVRCV